jgi:hypothetical protein
MSAVAVSSLSEGQRQALETLHSIARASDSALTVDLDYQGLHGYYLVVRVYLSSASLRSSEQGIKLEDWEPIDILIPEDFPYASPIAWAGRDFPDLPHQAVGSGFCVRVEDGNWDPTAGMRGFIRAVIDTYQHIALGTLQGHLQPWRPTVGTVGYQGEGWAVIKADVSLTGRTASGDWRQWAIGRQINESRIDIVEWLDVVDNAATPDDLTEALTEKLTRINAETSEAFLIPAVSMAKPVAVEYSHSWPELLDRLEAQGVERVPLLGHLAQAAAINQPSSDGEERAAVLFRVAADTEPTAAGQDARFAVARLTQRHIGFLADLLVVAQAAQAVQDDGASPGEFLAAVMEKLPAAALAEPVDASVPWIRVYDGRRESVLSRAAGRPTERLAGKQVLLLGCGGLGAPIAEHCVRSGAARLHVVDSGTVSPGVLSRQPYEDADIGKPKAEVLAGRLGRIRPAAEITASVADVISADLFNGPDLGRYDLVIDATANRSVATRIERARREQRDLWPALITVAISQRATHGVAAVTPQGTTGAGVDLLRRLGLKTCMSTALSDAYTAFFPPESSRLNFRPDASCSDTTFIGSSTDLSTLAAQLLRTALTRLDLTPHASGNGSTCRSLGVVRLGHDDESQAALVMLDLPPDRVVADHRRMYEVRVDETAMETIREHVRASVNGRTGGAGVTGGLLLGQFDSTCRVAWVSQATGLPRGCSASPLKIDRDADDVRDFLADRGSRSGGLLTLIGFWHTHVGGSAEPSQVDVETVRQTATSPGWRPASALLLELTVAEDRSVGESGSPWLPQVHAETFGTGPDLADDGQ